MNINEVQKSNNETIPQTSNTARLKILSSKNKDGNDFSYYVEVSKTREVKEEIQNKNEENNNQTPTEEDLLKTQEIQEEAPLAYVNSFNNLNSEIFDMGISEAKQNNNMKDMFKYQINLSDLTMNDIKLFEGLTQKGEVSINAVDSTNQNLNMTINGENLNVSYRSIEVSKTLFNALEKAFETGKSVRLDFGKDTSVILRISRDGKLSADFVPNEKAMEAVLRNALPQLKAKLEEQNLPYGELNYRSYNQQKNNQKENNKEKKDE